MDSFKENITRLQEEQNEIKRKIILKTMIKKFEDKIMNSQEPIPKIMDIEKNIWELNNKDINQMSEILELINEINLMLPEETKKRKREYKKSKFINLGFKNILYNGNECKGTILYKKKCIITNGENKYEYSKIYIQLTNLKNDVFTEEYVAYEHILGLIESLQIPVNHIDSIMLLENNNTINYININKCNLISIEEFKSFLGELEIQFLINHFFIKCSSVPIILAYYGVEGWKF